MKKTSKSIMVTAGMIAVGTCIYYICTSESSGKASRAGINLSESHDRPSASSIVGKDENGFAAKNSQAEAAEKPTKTPVPVVAQAPEGTAFVKSHDSSTYTIVGGPTYKSIAKDGNVLVSFVDWISSVREAPDQRMFVYFGPPHGWQIHRITEAGCVKVEDKLPKIEDLQLYWSGSQTLVGVSVIYEQNLRPGMEDWFAENTRLFVYDVETAESRDIDMSGIKREPGTFFRIDGVSNAGYIKMSLVNSEQYFDEVAVRERDLGTFKIVD
jgi:hypothetical protein